MRILRGEPATTDGESKSEAGGGRQHIRARDHHSGTAALEVKLKTKLEAKVKEEST
jgi:hypothetical protein